MTMDILSHHDQRHLLDIVRHELTDFKPEIFGFSRLLIENVSGALLNFYAEHAGELGVHVIALRDGLDESYADFAKQQNAYMRHSLFLFLGPYEANSLWKNSCQLVIPGARFLAASDPVIEETPW